LKFGDTAGWKTCATVTVHEGAFTLLELLIAVSIFAIVLAAINGLFYGAMRLRRNTTRSIEESLPIQQTLATLKRDLQGLVAPGGILAGPLQTTTSSGLTPGVIPPGAMTLYTSTGVIDETLPWADVQKVVYYLKQPDNPAGAVGKDLVRAVSRDLLASTPAPMEEQWLMGGVERLQFSFYDGNAWRDTWDSTTADLATAQTNRLPRAIKAQIDLAVARGEPRTRAPAEIVVPITVQARTNQTQRTGT